MRPDLPATVRFVAYKQRITPTVDGKVTCVSADAITEERTGASYFLATIEVAADQLSRVPNVKLYPRNARGGHHCHGQENYAFLSIPAFHG